MMTADELLLGISKKFSLNPPLEFDEDRICELVFDDRVWVEFYLSEDEDVLNLSTLVAFLPEEPAIQADVEELLLSANLFGRGTGGAKFSVDSENNEVVLTSTIDVIEVELDEVVKAIGEPR